MTSATEAGASATRKKAGSPATTKSVPEVSSEAVDKENTSREDESTSSGQDTPGNATIVKTTITTADRRRRGTTAGAK